MFTMQRVEVQALACYLECGGLKGNNLQTLRDIDNTTRGGKDPFICALDGNVDPKAWEDYMTTDGSLWLDKMAAEIVTIRNGTFTCRSGLGTEGGSMIDYFIVSKSLIPLITTVVAVMDAPWGPHFGLSMKLLAIPQEILLSIFVQPALPSNRVEVFKAKPPQKKTGAKDKLARQQERDEQHARDIYQQACNGDLWCQTFLKASWGEEALDSEDPAQAAISGYAETMGIPAVGNALTGNFGRWCRSLGGYIEAKCEAHDEKETEDSTERQQHKPTTTRRSSSAQS